MTLSAWPLLTKKKTIQVEIETTPGTRNGNPSATALFVSDCKINPTGGFIERPGSGLYRGHSAKGVVGGREGACDFNIELRGGASAGTCESGLAILLQAGSLVKSSEVFSMHSTPATDKTISIDVFEDGVQKSLLGASATWTLEGEAGGRVVLAFKFKGIWQVPADVAMPAYAPSVLLPLMMQGGTFSLATLAIKINKFAFDMGCKTVARADVNGTGGIAYFMPTDVLPMLSIDPEAHVVGATGYDYYGVWLAGTEAVVSMVITNGVTKLTIAIPAFQSREVTEGDRDGILIYDVNGQCNHTGVNNAVTFTFAAA